jgi:hypothetical protein
MKDSKWVYYYNPSKGSDQDKCVKNHPLRDIAQRCAGISTSEDKGHIYVALLKVDRQWKHYVGKADHLWENRWKDHEQSIESALKHLLKNPPTQEAPNFPSYFHIKMATAILEFILNSQSVPGPAIVVYKIQCSLVRAFGYKNMKSFEQHFMNVFRDIKGTEELNDCEGDKNHPYGKLCPFSGGTKTCEQFLIDFLNYIEVGCLQNLTFTYVNLFQQYNQMINYTIHL